MKFHQSDSSLYIPDHAAGDIALSRTTHLGIGAHQDDLEFMAFHGILSCYDQAERWFGGVTCTNGSGSARNGPFADYSDEQMMVVRREEQNQAARIGQYSFMAQLDYPSAVVKDPQSRLLVDDLVALLQATRPQVVYTHNPADKHDTHVAVTASVLRAIHALPRADRPERLLGCEVWRDLDWMLDADKVMLDVSHHDALAEELNKQFVSQIAGGKRYDLAVEGRRRANATFFESHSTDAVEKAWVAMDLTPLIMDEDMDLTDFTLKHIDRFHADVERKLKKYSSGA